MHPGPRNPDTEVTVTGTCIFCDLIRAEYCKAQLKTYGNRSEGDIMMHDGRAENRIVAGDDTMVATIL